VTGLLERWNLWLYAPSSGQRIGVVRILLATYLLCYLGTFAGHVELSFSKLGVYTPYGAPDYAPGPAVAWAIYLLTMLACVLLLIGYRTRIVAPLLFLLFGYAYFLQLGVKESSFDRLIAIDLLVLSCADSGRAFGLDARRPGPTPLVWPERMLQLQTVLTYFGPGLWKLLVPAWHDGVLLYSNLHGMWATPLAFRIVRAGFSPETWAAFSWCIIAFELLLGPLFLLRKTRRYALVLGTSFHVLNCVVLVVPEFLISLAAYPVFVAPATLQRWAERLRAVFSARSPAPRPP
jgi:vitamin K-dependent gamma-carboxylase